MRKRKKFFAFLLAAAMACTTMLAGTTTAMADPAESHTITIGNGVTGESYYAYKVLDVTLADTNTQAEGYEAFSYSIKTDNPFFDTVTGHTSGGEFADSYTNWGMTFTKSANFAVDSTYVMTAPSSAADMGNVQAAQLAAAVGAYVLANDSDHSDADGTLASYSDTDKTITVNELGYYFIDTTLGALCSLDTTATDVTIYEKNTHPTIGKTVKDSADADTAYAKTADVHGGDTVNYKLVVNTGTNQFWDNTDDDRTDPNYQKTGVDEDYVIVDTLPENVVMDVDSTQTAPTNIPVAITDADNNTWVVNTDYTAVYDAADNKLTITLKGGAATNALRKLGQNKDITLIYTAKVTDTAVNDAALTNEAVLAYKQQTDTDTAKVYSWSFDTLKYTGTLGTTLAGTTKLANATFQFLDAQKATLLLISEGNNVYRYDSRAAIQSAQLSAEGTAEVTDPDDATKTVTVVNSITTDATGAFKVEGLDSATYYLRETKAPSGYNLMQSDVTVEISATADTTAGTMTHTVAGTTTLDDTDYITIENKTGAELPSTGGMGTTMFYIVGSILVFGAGVVLVARRRMNRR